MLSRVPALTLAAVVVVAMCSTVSSASAAGDADEAKGLVAERCSECHAVPGYSAEGLPTLEAPAFQTIADDPATYTEARLRASLLQPHWPMGQFNLSSSDIDNIVAYLKSLGAN